MPTPKKRKVRPKTPKLNSVPVGALVPQPNGRGALRNGGTNKGGPGRLPEVLRFKSRELFGKWVDWASEQIEPKDRCKECGRAKFEVDPNVANQIGKTAGRHGLSHEDMISRVWIRELLNRQVDVITNGWPPQEAERILAALSPIWKSA